MNRHEKALALLHQGTVIPANPLALDANRQFDEKRQKLLTRYYLEAGSGGIAVAVHTTQFEIRLPQYNLLETVLRAASEEIDDYEARTQRVVVKVAGACGETQQAVAEAQLAKSLGYDAVLLSPGGLNHHAEEYLLERAKAVAAILPVIGFYLQTAVGGRVFSYSFWQKMAEIPNVVAIKCASFNRYTTLDVMRAVANSSRCDEIAMYTGNDDNIVVDLLTQYSFKQGNAVVSTQFVGGLLGHWSVWTQKAVELFNAVQDSKKRGEMSAEMLTLAASVTDTNAVLFDAEHQFKGCIAGLHEVLRRQGLMEGIWCLNPEETLSPGQAEEIDRIYAMYPGLHDDNFVQQNLAAWKADLGI